MDGDSVAPVISSTFDSIIFVTVGNVVTVSPRVKAKPWKDTSYGSYVWINDPLDVRCETEMRAL